MERKKHYVSVRQMIAGLCTILIVALAGMVTVLLYTGNRIIDQYVNDVGTTALSSFQSDLDRNLQDITSYCTRNLSGSKVTLAYNRPDSDMSAYELRENIRDTLQQLFNIQSSIRLVEYTPSNGGTQAAVRLSSFSSLAEADAAAEALRTANLPDKRWRWLTIAEKSFLCCSLTFSDGSCSVCMDDSILTAAKGRMTDLRYTCEQDGVFIGGTSAQFSASRRSARPLSLFNGDRDVLLEQPSDQGDYSYCCLVSMADTSLNQSLRYAYCALFLLLILIGIIGTLFFHHVAVCFTAIDDACRRFGSGELDTRIDQDTHLREAEHIFGTFNTMTGQIRELKISLYEHELAEEHSKLRLLRTQIKSHFFINCLNIIYSLASVGNNALIKEFSLCLVDYFRYLGSGFQNTVRLGSELEHLKNYVRIFEIRYPGRITVNWQIDPDLEYFPVLPMVSQTFVENVFQHGMEPGKPIHLDIRVLHDTLRGEEGVRIDIFDDGPGFSAEALENMGRQPETTDPQAEHGNGIRNALQRMKLFYGGRAELRCENTEKGAHVSLFFPNPD